MRTTFQIYFVLFSIASTACVSDDELDQSESEATIPARPSWLQTPNVMTNAQGNRFAEVDRQHPAHSTDGTHRIKGQVTISFSAPLTQAQRDEGALYWFLGGGKSSLAADVAVTCPCSKAIALRIGGVDYAATNPVDFVGGDMMCDGAKEAPDGADAWLLVFAAGTLHNSTVTNVSMTGTIEENCGGTTTTGVLTPFSLADQ